MTARADPHVGDRLRGLVAFAGVMDQNERALQFGGVDIQHVVQVRYVSVTVSSGSHRKDLIVDQTVSLPDGKHFRPIDTVDLAADTETIIQITNSNAVGFVILDALQLLPINHVSK